MNFIFTNKEGIRITIQVSEDANLTETFAKFVDLTRMIGYYSDSWNNIIKELNDCEFDDKYTIYDWAIDTIY